MFLIICYISQSNSIHASDSEWKEMVKGNNLIGKDGISIILHHLGIPLYKRPPKPKEEGEEDGDQD